MRCERARRLIHAHAEGLLAGGERPALEAHIAACHACATYESQAQGLLREIDLDAGVAGSAAVVTDEFQSRLRDALRLEREGHERKPLRRFARAVDMWLNARSFTPRLAVRMSLAALLLVLAMLVAPAMLSAPEPGPRDCRFDHIAAFSTQRSADGRVYASLTQHESARRWNPGEAHTR